jgi:hypothetical protein
VHKTEIAYPRTQRGREEDAISAALFARTFASSRVQPCPSKNITLYHSSPIKLHQNKAYTDIRASTKITRIKKNVKS